MNRRQSVVTRLAVVVGEGLEQLFLDEKIELEPLPVQIREIQAVPTIISFRLIPGHLIVEGTVGVRIYFISSEKIVYHQQQELKFSCSMAVHEAEPGMEAEVYCLDSYVFYELLEDNSLRLKLILELYARVCRLTQLEIETGGDKPVRIQEQYLEEKMKELLQLEIPFEYLAAEISRIEDSIEETSSKLLKNRVCLEGIIRQQVYYSDQEGVERYKVWESKFDFCFELTGAEEEMFLESRFLLEEVSSSLVEFGRAARRKLALTILLKLSKPVQLFLGGNGNTLVWLPLIIGEKSKEIFNEQRIELDAVVKKVREDEQKVTKLKTYVLTDKLIVEANVESRIFYIDHNFLERYIFHSWQFNSILDLPGAVKGMKGHSEVKVVFTDFVLEGGGKVICQRAVFQLLGRVTDNVQLLVKRIDHAEE